MKILCFYNSTFRNMCALSNMDVVCIVNNSNNNNIIIVSSSSIMILA
jgi:hypothetical protein